MENLNSATKAINSIWDQLTHAPSHLLFLAVFLFLGMLIKKSPLPNWTIPWLLSLLGATVYPFIATPTNMDPSFRDGAEIWVLAFYGFLLGIGSVVLHRWLRQFAWFQKIESAVVGDEPAAPKQDVPPAVPPAE